MASCADSFPTQQLKMAKLLSPSSLACTHLVAPIGLVPAAENPQGLGFRLSRFLRLWVAGLSRRLLSSCDAHNKSASKEASMDLCCNIGHGFLRSLSLLKSQTCQPASPTLPKSLKLFVFYIGSSRVDTVFLSFQDFCVEAQWLHKRKQFSIPTDGQQSGAQNLAQRSGRCKYRTPATQAQLQACAP